jgi:AcrR family transcriptional regulator
MGKSLTETAKAILMKEGVIPSVSSSDSNPDRDAKSSNPNMATLRPNSKGAEGRFSNPGAKAPTGGPEATLEQPHKPGDGENAGAKFATKGKDSSIKGADKKGESWPVKNPGSKTSSAEIMEEDEVEGTVVAESEEIEISEELESFINEMIEKGLSEEEIAQAIDENFEVIEEDVEELAEETEEYAVDMSEAIEALFAGEELSEEFKEKAKTIFEAAVTSKVEEEIKKLEEAYAETLEEQIESIQEELSSNVDDYLNYVVEHWVNENEVAIEAGLRTELTEEFISGLRNLFAEHYIDIPEDKVSVVEEMGAKVAELEEKLNEEIERNVHLSKVLNESVQNEIVSSYCDGLTDTQASKLKSLVEGLEFTSPQEFAQKVEVLRESYFNSSVNNKNVLDNNEVATDEGKGVLNEELQGPMAAYVRTLGRKLPN